MLMRTQTQTSNSGLGVIWEPGNTWSDYLCLLPGTGSMSMCAPAQTISQIRNAGGLDCTQSGWRGRGAECAAANNADDETFRAILARESATNPDLYREWYEASGGESANPGVPAPQFTIPSWAWLAGIGILAVWIISRR
jgi:hypothetical protein